MNNMNAVNDTNDAVTSEVLAQPEQPVEPVLVLKSETASGTIIEPGTYLVEMVSKRPILEKDFIVALAMMGWDEPLIDQTKPNETLSDAWALWSPCSTSDEEDKVVTRLRFIAHLDETIQIQESPLISWTYLQNISFDPFGNIRRDSEVVPHALITDALYELRLLSRLRIDGQGDKSRREALFEQLSQMGFEPLKMSTLKRTMRLQGSSGANVTMWYALARWTGPMSYITDEDPLYFEDVVKIGDPSTNNTSEIES